MNEDKFNFIKEIPNFIDYFGEEDRFLIELIGLNNFLLFYERYSKTGYYCSSTPILKLKQAWCLLNADLKHNELARKLDVSIKTISRWLKPYKNLKNKRRKK